jgi:hypothetical protein
LTTEARRVVRFRVSRLLLAHLNPRTQRQPERVKPDPRQLALPIDTPQEECPNGDPVMTPSLTTGRRKTARKTSEPIQQRQPSAHSNRLGAKQGRAVICT